MLRVLVFMAVLLAGCNPNIYVRDGVTDGDTFYLAPIAWADDDPVLQSWVTYSLVKSTCQLEIGGENPARASSYGCEFSARLQLLEAWEEKRGRHGIVADTYLDTLLAVREAGFLDEYTVHFFGDDSWLVPAEVDLQAFSAWRRSQLRRHRPQTRLIGSWAYKEKVGGLAVAGQDHG
jgi:hypothetical protein